MKNRIKTSAVSALLILASLALSGCGVDAPAVNVNLQLVQTTFKTSRVTLYPGYSCSRFLVLKDGVVFDVTTNGNTAYEPKITSVVVLLEP